MDKLPTELFGVIGSYLTMHDHARAREATRDFDQPRALRRKRWTHCRSQIADTFPRRFREGPCSSDECKRRRASCIFVDVTVQDLYCPRFVRVLSNYCNVHTDRFLDTDALRTRSSVAHM